MTVERTGRLAELEAASRPTEILAALAASGAVIVHDLVPPEVLSALRADLHEIADGRQPGTDTPSEALRRFWGEHTVRFTQLSERSAAFRRMLDDPTLHAVARALLLPHCTSYWLNTGQAMFLAPGQVAQQLHRDADNWWRINRPDGPEVTVSCMVALDDFTAANGATHVVPGSHRWPDFARLPDASDPIVQAVMPAGSALLYTGKVLHGGGENRSAAWRRGLHLSFVLGWLTPEEAVPLAVSWETVRDAPAHVQQLLGWRSTTLSDGGGRLWTIDYEDVPVGLSLA